MPEQPIQGTSDDLQSFYYSASILTTAIDLDKCNMFRELIALKAIFGKGAAAVTMKLSNGNLGRVDLPPVGFNPGNPISGFFAALPVALRYNEALTETANIYSNEDPHASLLIKNERMEFVKNNVFAVAVVDDVKSFGKEELANLLCSTFCKNLNNGGIAGLAPDKSMIKNMGGQIISREQIAEAVRARATPKDLEIYNTQLPDGPNRIVGDYYWLSSGPKIIPITNQVDQGTEADEPPPRFGQVGVGGAKFVGAYAGSVLFLKEAAKKLYEEHLVLGKRLLQIPSYHQIFLLNRLGVVPRCMFHARVNGGDPEFIDGYFRPALDLQRVIAAELKGSDLSMLELRSFFQPMAFGGCGIQNVADVTIFAFLGSALLAFLYITVNFPNKEHILNRRMSQLLDGSLDTPYARAIRDAITEFYKLFSLANNREPTIPLDGFDKLSGLIPIARKFQARAAKMIAELENRNIPLNLTPTQQVARKSYMGASPPTAILSAMPAVGLPHIPNSVFSLILNERLLNQDIGGIVGSDVCPGSGKGCNLKGPLSLDHIRGCVHATVTKGAKCQPHQVVQEIVRQTFLAAGVRSPAPG